MPSSATRSSRRAPARVSAPPASAASSRATRFRTLPTPCASRRSSRPRSGGCHETRSHRRSRAALPRRDRHRHRQPLPARDAAGPRAGRLRAVPGPEAAPAAQLEPVSGRPRVDRRGRAHPRAPRSLAAICPALARHGFRGPIFATAGHAGARRHRAARQRAHPGGGRRLRQPPRLLEAHAGAAALHQADAERVLGAVPDGTVLRQPIEIAPGVRATFLPAGHILGSAMVAAHDRGRATADRCSAAATSGARIIRS